MENTRPTSSAQKVAVIDDCPEIRALIKARLREERVDIFFAGGGVEGLELVKTVLPDLILLDVDMPDLDGLAVITRLKADPLTHNIAVIFLTGDSSPAAKVKGFDLGAVDYVTKPFEPAELRARVRSSLRTKYLLDLLSQRAMLDGLTGLWNRAYFNDRLAALSPATSADVPDGAALVMLDVDHFKKINDTHGHPFGDEVLRAVARMLGERCRAADVVCRYGGEEFAVVCTASGGDGARGLAESLRAGVKSLVFSRPVSVTASFGVASYAQPMTPADLVSAADKALYTAKHAGRDRVELAPATPPAHLNAAA